jgi:hypothetical protein
MLTTVRRKIARIEYYSAPRRSTFWTKAMDVALVVALLLALPVVWVLQTGIGRSREVLTVEGLLLEVPDGGLMGRVLEPDRPQTLPPDSELLATFILSQQEQRRGWPLTTSIWPQPVELTLDVHKEARPRGATTLEPDDPLRLAIETTLRDEGRNEILSAWRHGEYEPRPLLRGWTASFMFWSVVLAVVLAVTVRVSQYGWRVLEGRRSVLRRSRRRAGLCEHCGYDMTGLEFNEVCPECGSRT